MVELKIKEKEIEELNKRIDELEKEVKAKSVQLDEAIKLNQKLVVALEEIYAKM
jgi:cell division septum initiation protein DivIVA